MQNAKDAFYEVLRDRLADRAPDRTVVVRGVTRPAVVVLENELPAARGLLDCFLLQWDEMAVDANGAFPTVTMTCAIAYATAGTAMNGGLDRGRVLAALDGELCGVLAQLPQSVARQSGAGSGRETGAETGTRVWWSEVRLGSAKAVGEQLQRTASVTVMSFAEAGAA